MTSLKSRRDIKSDAIRNLARLVNHESLPGAHAFDAPPCNRLRPRQCAPIKRSLQTLTKVVSMLRLCETFFLTMKRNLSEYKATNQRARDI